MPGFGAILSISSHTQNGIKRDKRHRAPDTRSDVTDFERITLVSCESKSSPMTDGVVVDPNKKKGRGIAYQRPRVSKQQHKRNT